MKINEVIGEWVIMPQTIKPLGLIRKPGGGFDFKNKGNNRANEKAPPGREKQVKALKGKVDNPYAVAWASYNKSKNKTNEAPIEQDHNNPIAKPYVDMPEWKALHDMDDKIIDAYIKHKGNNKANKLDEGMKIANLVGQSIAHLEMYVELASDVKKQYPTLSSFTKIKAEQVLRSVPLLINDLRKPGIWSEEDAAGVGIITKQNTTKDVNGGTLNKMLRNFHLIK